MKLSEFKNQLKQFRQVNFIKPDGTFVPRHFHITEAGLISKNYIDCGGLVSNENKISLQLWVAEDFDHRLSPQKLSSILEIAQPLIGPEDPEIEIEYQGETINKFGVDINGENFSLTPLFTECLAKDKCGIPLQKPKLQLAEIKNSCTPGSGCC